MKTYSQARTWLDRFKLPKQDEDSSRFRWSCLQVTSLPGILHPSLHLTSVTIMTANITPSSHRPSQHWEAVSQPSLDSHSPVPKTDAPSQPPCDAEPLPFLQPVKTHRCATHSSSSSSPARSPGSLSVTASSRVCCFPGCRFSCCPCGCCRGSTDGGGRGGRGGGGGVDTATGACGGRQLTIGATRRGWWRGGWAAGEEGRPV
jgi:hypothetical protein